ncbi:Integrase catalytic domain-containing protein [Citrus sinensis]|nr:Integrase catalytic domain-containing protein [Citrus sinensis]
MRIYLQALDYEIWEIVNDGPFMPLTKSEVEEDIPKPSRDWNEFEKRKASLNSKAMNALFCALDKKEFHRVSSCESANEIWHKLKVVYEGTNQVKESKISRYTRQYELFQMEQNENVYSMYTRFTDIVNTLGALGKTFSNSEKVKKIIRSLPKEWRPKRTTIEEDKDLNVLPIDDLIGSFISYEEDLATEKGHEKKKKNIALKASKRESDEESEIDDEELAMLARRLRKFYKKNNEQRKFRGYKNKKEKNEQITCYECKKPGHIRPECPLLNKLKKKAMVATWDDSDEETSDDDEQQEMKNLALMAVGEESCDELDEVSVLPTYDELHDAFKDLHDELMKIGKTNICLKKKMIELKSENDSFSAKITCLELENKTLLDNIALFENSSTSHEHLESHMNELKNENEMLRKKSNELNEIVLKFTNGQKDPQQNGVVERKNRSIQEMARTMLNENALSKYFWAEAVNTACYVLNRVLIRHNLNKTPYEMWKDRKPNIGYFKVFECKCFVLNTKDNLGKFDPKSDVGIFLGYSNSSKAYRVYNKRTLVVEESMHVTFDESNPSSTEKVIVDDNAEEEQQEEASSDNQEDAPHGIQEEHHEETNVKQNEGTSQTLPKEWRYVSSHPKDVILGDPSRGVTTRSSLRNTYFSSCMSQEFEMSMMGELKYFLGLQIKQNEEGIFINQAKYVKDLLKRFGYDNGTAKSTPMSTTIKLDKDEKGKEVDIKTYRGMIGSLLYLTASRPDIIFSVCLCARFQSCPKESHMLAVKRIFRYLLGTINLGLWYPRGTHIDLICYSDADFAGYKVDRKSTSGTCHFLGHSLVSWFSKKQNSVALSTTEAEYIAAAALWQHSGLIRSTGSGKPASQFSLAILWIQPASRIVISGKPDSIEGLVSHNRISGSSQTGKPFTDVGWLNALVVEENVYPDLVKVFYSNMDYSAEKENRVITTVGGVLIEFDDSELNSILGSSDDGLEIFSPRKPPDIDDYVYIDAVKNICRRVDLSDEDCTIHFHNLCLCLQSHILFRFIQSIVLPRSGHLDEVSHMDVALIDCFLRHRPVDLGYTIVRNMLSIPKLITRSLLYGHFITRILKFFDVPIKEPLCRPSKGIGDDAIVGLGFEWKNGTLVKYSENKFTFLAPSDDRPLNVVVPADQLPIFSLSFRGQRRRRDLPVIASAPDVSASVSSPPRPPTSGDVTLQHLMDEVRTLSVRQTEFQQEQQQLIHGQRLLFEHFGIPYPFPPPSPPSSPPE